MKFSELWLREWVDPGINSANLVEQITMLGFEVNSVKPVAGCFTGVVVGQILECQTNPNINKLRYIKVDIGSDRSLNIICNAPNCRTGLRVAVATTDARLPGNFHIKTAKLHGEQLSEGMLCSFTELGIVGDYHDIIELPSDAPIGQDIRDYLKLEDNIIDINVTPNRADCLGLLGIARDIAVRNRISLMQPVIEKIAPVIGDTLPIYVNETDICPIYLGRIIKNINVRSPTPLWMKEKLRRCGLYSIDAVVDIINFVLIELGQPMHVFDLDRIEGGIIVRYAEKNEVITLLNGNDIKLSTDTLVIADHRKVLEIAGICGSVTSGINLTTRDIVLECAFFHPMAITDCTRRYGLHTNSSHRYERGVDPELPPRAIERASALLIAICGGQPGPVINVTSSSMLEPPITVTLHRKTLDWFLGHVIPDRDVVDILSRLGCQISHIETGWQVITPSWRFDIAIEQDLIEEIARIYGYDAIPNIPMRVRLMMPLHSETTLSLIRMKMLLVDRGYQEVITYSFVDPKIQKLLHPNQVSIVLPNPISQNMSVMRLSLWTGLLGVVIYNQNRQQQRIRLFESGLCFIPDNEADLGIRQDLVLSGVISGFRFDEHWDQERQLVDFYDAKGDLEAILELSGKLDDIEFRIQHQNLALHPGQSATIYLNNELIGFIGVLHPYIEKKLNLNGRTVVFELLWEKINICTVPQASNISHFPANRRDIAIVVSDDVSAADIIAECKKVVKNQLVSINLFDLYRGRGVAEGFKSLAISLILQDAARTLKEEEIASTVTKCIAALEQRFQASLRD